MDAMPNGATRTHINVVNGKKIMPKIGHTKEPPNDVDQRIG
jgi:hypothetical protein